MLTHEQITTGLGSTLRRMLGSGDVTVERAVADSRLCRAGDLFVALPGEQVDGNDYVLDAFARGAAAALAARPPRTVPEGRRVYETPDALRALQTLAGWWRARFSPRVVVLTGTVGKTSTKEITAHVLAAHRRVLKSEATFNGEIGLPLMLLRLRPEHELAVLELGMFHEGEIRLQCELARPRYGIVTNVGYTHAERLGSIDAIARAKRELVEELPAEGVVALNADDARVLAMAASARCRVVTYGLGATADLRAEAVENLGLGGLGFRIVTPEGETAPVRTPLIGRHNVHNCLAAAAVALAEGVTLAQVAAALATATNPLRLTALPGPNGSTLLDDAYNAGPASMAAALDLLAVAGDGGTEAAGTRPSVRRIAVLGDMLELGAEEERLHRELGVRAAQVADVLLLVGSRMRWAAEAARTTGGAEVRYLADVTSLAGIIRQEAREGDVILFKASRGMALERVIETLRTGPAGLSRHGGTAGAEQAARGNGAARANGPAAAEVVASHPMP